MLQVPVRANVSSTEAEAAATAGDGALALNFIIHKKSINIGIYSAFDRNE